MDFLAKRSHSEQELFVKLSRDFAESEVKASIEHAKKSGWLEDPQELSQKVALELDQKGKGALYIRSYLENKGLPPILIDPHKELEKALRVIEKKQKIGHSFANKRRSTEELQQIASILKNRGFEYEIIRKVVDGTSNDD